MAVRTTPGLVAEILGRNYDGRTPLTVFIRIASSFVDRVVTCAAAQDPAFTHTATELKDIETLIAAHAYQAMDQGYSSKSTAGASGQFQGQTAMYLEGTKYGQLAIVADTSGCVKSLSTQNVAGMDWLGKPPSAQIDYIDRD